MSETKSLIVLEGKFSNILELASVKARRISEIHLLQVVSMDVASQLRDVKEVSDLDIEIRELMNRADKVLIEIRELREEEAFENMREQERVSK